jgi:hypothetical protein
MSALSEMIVELPEVDVPGYYDEASQVWSVECDAQKSPQKHHQEN